MQSEKQSSGERSDRLDDECSDQPACKSRRIGEPGGSVDLEDMRRRMQATIGSSVAALTTKFLKREKAGRCNMVPGAAQVETSRLAAIHAEQAPVPTGNSSSGTVGKSSSTEGTSSTGAEVASAIAGARPSKGVEPPAFHDPHVKECYYHFKTGHCRLGPRCPYAHEAVDGQFSSSVSASAAGMSMAGVGLDMSLLSAGISPASLGIVRLGLPGLGPAGLCFAGMGHACAGSPHLLPTGMGTMGLSTAGAGPASLCGVGLSAPDLRAAGLASVGSGFPAVAPLEPAMSMAAGLALASAGSAPPGIGAWPLQLGAAERRPS